MKEKKQKYKQQKNNNKLQTALHLDIYTFYTNIKIFIAFHEMLLNFELSVINGMM